MISIVIFEFYKIRNFKITILLGDTSQNKQNDQNYQNSICIHPVCDAKKHQNELCGKQRLGSDCAQL